MVGQGWEVEAPAETTRAELSSQENGKPLRIGFINVRATLVGKLRLEMANHFRLTPDHRAEDFV
jgi:hypothetical protein